MKMFHMSWRHFRWFFFLSSVLQIFETQRMKFSEIPQRLHALLMPPEPIIINHVIRWPHGCRAFTLLKSLLTLISSKVVVFSKDIRAARLPQCTTISHLHCHPCSVDPNDQKKTACYDIDVEVDDTLKTQMNSFLLSTASQQEIAGLDNKVEALRDCLQLRGGTLLLGIQGQSRFFLCEVIESKLQIDDRCCQSLDLLTSHLFAPG